jgi:hypothetical protein
MTAFLADLDISYQLEGVAVNIDAGCASFP